MVTSNKLPDKKVVKMAEQKNSIVIPQRTLLGEVNEHITCPLCRGYYIDATTIVECLHSFCRSCIIKHLQVKSYCPVCEMMINSAKPNIKLDKALQDIVYKLVPGLFQREMERRQTFYASRPSQAATATPEQRGEDTERIIFSPEDVISFSLEYSDATDTDSISSKSSDSNEPQPVSVAARRYLQCPAVVNISHLKKFLCMKFDIDSTQFAIDILYKRVPLPEYYTLMDIAYIYNWKRNEPMRFFYQIIDFVAIRNRFFDINKKETHIKDRKLSPTPNEDMNVNSPAPQVNNPGSEASSGTDSPLIDENNSKQVISSDSAKNLEHCTQLGKNVSSLDNLNLSETCHSSSMKNDNEVEKSQFLNSFELTAKSSSTSEQSSPVKTNIIESSSVASAEVPSKTPSIFIHSEDSLKRKQQHQHSQNIPEVKKIKTEVEKSKHPDTPLFSSGLSKGQSNKDNKLPEKSKETESLPKTADTINRANSGSTTDVKQPLITKQSPDSQGTKKANLASHNSSPKRKWNDPITHVQQSLPTAQKTVSSIKLQFPAEIPKPIVKKMPDLKLSTPLQQSSQSKNPPISKVRMDLLANNSDPTIDRTKILSQVKTSLGMVNPVPSTGDPLKSLFDSCKINIPSSLSITLTDQKQDSHVPGEATSETKKNIINKNTSTHKVPTPPVHNYIEILKLPDVDSQHTHKHTVTPTIDSQKTSKSDLDIPNKTENVTSLSKTTTKNSETSSKGPIPNLKPIADAKIGKQSATSSSHPITFQQTFEQQLQSLQSDKKPKLPKTKAQVPKLVPANPKTFNAAASKLSNLSNILSQSGISTPVEGKSSTALDLTTPISIQSQLTPHQTKAFETMQSKAFEIANLAKKQNLASKGASPAIPHNFSAVTRPIPSASPLRLPSMANVNQLRQEKSQGTPSSLEMSSKSSQLKTTVNQSPLLNPSFQVPPHNSLSPIQSTARQTRSPSSSPKLVIAEEKQSNVTETNINQSNQISSTQAANAPKSVSPKTSPGPSKVGPKPMKPLPPANKMVGIRQPVNPIMKQNSTDFEYISAHHALLRRHMEVNAWLKAQRFMTSMAHQSQNDFKKDK